MLPAYETVLRRLHKRRNQRCTEAGPPRPMRQWATFRPPAPILSERHPCNLRLLIAIRMVGPCASRCPRIERNPDAFIPPIGESVLMSDLRIEISKKDELIIELVRAEYLTNRMKENVAEFVQCPEAGYHQDRFLMRPSYEWARKIAAYAYDNSHNKNVFDSCNLLEYGVEDVVADCVCDDLIRAGVFEDIEDPWSWEPIDSGSDEKGPSPDRLYLDEMRSSFYYKKYGHDRWTELDALDPSTLAAMLKSTLDRYEQIVETLKKIAEM